jgi:hypothetical protein
LRQQSRILANIEAAIVREDEAAARRDEESARLLAEAVQRARRALEADLEDGIRARAASHVALS